MVIPLLLANRRNKIFPQFCRLSGSMDGAWAFYHNHYYIFEIIIVNGAAADVIQSSRAIKYKCIP